MTSKRNTTNKSFLHLQCNWICKWLIDLAEQKVHIYRKDGSTDIIGSFDEKASGEDVLQGFELDLAQLKYG